MLFSACHQSHYVAMGTKSSFFISQKISFSLDNECFQIQVANECFISYLHIELRRNNGVSQSTIRFIIFILDQFWMDFFILHFRKKIGNRLLMITGREIIFQLSLTDSSVQNMPHRKKHHEMKQQQWRWWKSLAF